jgi:regulation of enolase protein 1 (concanavalin A-like superfamily)
MALFDVAEIKASFTASADPKTDLWRQPPSTNVSNAPIELLAEEVDIKQFVSAGASFKAEWSKRYDQAGIAIFFSKDSWEQKKWIKTGVEFYKNKPYLVRDSHATVPSP